MKRCCYKIENLQSYGATGKEVIPHRNLLVVRYLAYMRCVVCGGKLRSEVTKNIFSRAPKAKAKTAPKPTLA